MNKNLSKLVRISGKKTRIIVGLMSGTSMDGLDIALCALSGAGLKTRIKLLQFETVPYSPETKAQIAEVFAKKQIDFERLCLLNPMIGRLHAGAVLTALKKWKVPARKVDLIASHGQTVFHAPAMQHPAVPGNATLQIGDGDHMAVATGIITISDFRQKHIAKGGEGAPLAVYGDYLLLSHPRENRILLNVGGIGNFTFLPAGRNAAKVFVTDTGPGNTLMDQMIRKHLPGQYFDRDSATARKGTIHGGLLQALKSHPFFQWPLPKTTGPELFNLGYVQSAQQTSGTQDLPLADVMATLTRFSAETIADAIRAVTGKRKFEIYMSGGGRHNPLMVEQLQWLLKVPKVHATDELGIPGDAKEAMLFAVLANETVAGQAIDFGKRSKIPSVTMGKISFPD
jgi:anhydro-N-acetylmuramic acid kinase